jgi:hypothetical protein
MEKKELARGEGQSFWLVGTEVYRAPTGAEMDTWNLPMGRRWERSVLHWTRFRAVVYDWALNVAEEVC